MSQHQDRESFLKHVNQHRPPLSRDYKDGSRYGWDEADKAFGKRGGISPEQATEEKGYPHPGSCIKLPDNGGEIHFQYGHPQEVGRNGCFMHDVVQALIDNLEVYQQEGHPLACLQTGRTIDALKIAKGCILDRRSDRQERDVHQTDEP